MKKPINAFSLAIAMALAVLAGVALSDAKSFGDHAPPSVANR